LKSNEKSYSQEIKRVDNSSGPGNGSCLDVKIICDGVQVHRAEWSDDLDISDIVLKIMH